MDDQKLDMDYKKKALLYLEKNSDERFRFARALNAEPSPSPAGEEVAVADLVLERMKDPGPAHPVSEANAPQRLNVICRLAGQAGGPSLVLSGHPDAQPAGDRNRRTCDPYQGEAP